MDGGFNSITEIRSLNTEPPTIEKEKFLQHSAYLVIGYQWRNRECRNIGDNCRWFDNHWRL